MEVIDIEEEEFDKSSLLTCESVESMEVIDIEEEQFDKSSLLACETAAHTEVIDVEEESQKFPMLLSGTVHAQVIDVHGTQDFRNVDKCQIFALPLGADAILSSSDMDTACTSTPCENISLYEERTDSLSSESLGFFSKENTPLFEEGVDRLSTPCEDKSLRDHDSESLISSGNSFILIAEELDIGKQLELEVKDSDDALPMYPPSPVAATRFLRSASIIGHVQHKKQTQAWDFPLTEKEKCEHLINSLRNQIQELTFDDRRLGLAINQLLEGPNSGEFMRQNMAFMESLRHWEDAPMESLHHLEDKSGNVQCSWPSMPCGVEDEPIISPHACQLVNIEACEPYADKASCIYSCGYDYKLPDCKMRL